MTFPQFDEFQAALLAEVVRMKDTKGKEYANSDSRFANFDRLSVRLNIKSTAVALVYLTKHLDAIESYIAKGRSYSTESIQGRIIDAITYLTLIAGMIQEERLNEDTLKVEGILEQPTPYSPAIFISKQVASNLSGTTCKVCDQPFLPHDIVNLFSDGHYEHREDCKA